MNFKVVIEVSKNSKLKYEIDKNTGKLMLDRVLYGSNVYPQNYGYLEETLDLDGDPLDVLVVSNETFVPCSVIPVRILGALKMIDNGDRDAKLIGVVDVDPRYESLKNIEDLDKNILREIEDFFNNYKNLENKKVETSGFVNKEEAMKIIDEGKKLYSSEK